MRERASQTKDGQCRLNRRSLSKDILDGAVNGDRAGLAENHLQEVGDGTSGINVEETVLLKKSG